MTPYVLRVLLWAPHGFTWRESGESTFNLGRLAPAPKHYRPLAMALLLYLRQCVVVFGIVFTWWLGECLFIYGMCRRWVDVGCG